MASNGKVALVTGAGTGIGKSSVLQLLGDGYSVVLAGRRIEPLEETIAESGVDDSRAIAVSTDVGNPESVAELFEKAESTFGRLDVLFNNAGIKNEHGRSSCRGLAARGGYKSYRQFRLRTACHKDNEESVPSRWQNYQQRFNFGLYT